MIDKNKARPEENPVGAVSLDRSTARVEVGTDTRKLWLIIPSFYPIVGGTQTQVKDLAKAFIGAGRLVRVLTRRNIYGRVERLAGSEVVEGIPVTRVYSRGAGKTGAAIYLLGSLWQLLRHGRGGIYHAHDIGADAWVAVIASRLFGGRVVIKLRTGVRGYELRLSSHLARWLFLRQLRLADKIVVLSKEVERLVMDLGLSRQQVVLIPNGVDTNYFRPPSSEEKATSRDRIDIAAGKTLALFVGRLDPAKGVDVLLRAWGQLPQGLRSGSLLLLVGEGAERQKLLQMIRSLGLDESVVMVGEKQSVRDYYWAADVFLLPSRTEGLSNALNEAMACGLPVIASRVGGTPDVVAEHENGVLFESEDHDELARKLTTMWDLKSKWPEMGTCARETVTEYADLDVIVNRLNSLYDELN